MSVTTAPRYLTVTQAAEALGLRGPTPGARAQLLRRLEARRVIPPPHRSPVRRMRYWTPEEIDALRGRLEAWRTQR